MWEREGADEGGTCLPPAHNTTKAIIALLMKLAWSWGRLRARRCGAAWGGVGGVGGVGGSGGAV